MTNKSEMLLRRNVSKVSKKTLKLKLILKYTFMPHLNTYNLDPKPLTYNKHVFLNELYWGFTVSEIET